MQDNVDCPLSGKRLHISGTNNETLKAIFASYRKRTHFDNLITKPDKLSFHKTREQNAVTRLQSPEITYISLQQYHC